MELNGMPGRVKSSAGICGFYASRKAFGNNWMVAESGEKHKKV
jgi:hypothetical protein